MSKHKTPHNPPTFEEHQEYGAKLQLCYNFIASFRSVVAMGYGHDSKAYTALEKALGHLRDAKLELDQRVFHEHPQRSTQEVSHTYLAAHRVQQQGATFILSVDELPKATE